MNRIVAIAIAGLMAAPVYAQGDASAGEKKIKGCKACHSIVSGSGDVILKGGKTGPNLYGVIGRTAGTYEGYKYSKSLVAAGEAGLVWDTENLAEFIKNPTKFLRSNLDNEKARSKMSFKLKNGNADVAAYLASVAE
jgi:cytochrome c